MRNSGNFKCGWPEFFSCFSPPSTTLKMAGTLNKKKRKCNGRWFQVAGIRMWNDPWPGTARNVKCMWPECASLLQPPPPPFFSRFTLQCIVPFYCTTFIDRSNIPPPFFFRNSSPLALGLTWGPFFRPLIYYYDKLNKNNLSAFDPLKIKAAKKFNSLTNLF